MPVDIIQAKGSAGQVIWDFETLAYNCLNEPETIRRPWNIAFNSMDLALDRPLNQAETIRGDRNPSPPFQGNKDVSGSLVVPVSFYNSGLFFKAAIGNLTTTDVPTDISALGDVDIAAGGVAVFANAQVGLLLGDRIRLQYNDGSDTIVDGYITSRTDDNNMTIKLDRTGATDLPGLPQSTPDATVLFGVTSKTASAPVTMALASGIMTISAAQPSIVVGDIIIANLSDIYIVTELINPGTDTQFRVTDAEGFQPADDAGPVEIETIEAAPKWRHTFKIHPINSVPSFTLARGFRDITPEVWQYYTGCKVNTWTLEVGGDGELIQTLDIIGADEIASNSPYDSGGSPTALRKPLDRFEQFDATAQEGIPLAPVNVLKTVNFEVTNDLDEDSFTIGGQGTRAALPEGIAGVSGSISALFVDETILTKAQNNTTSALEILFTQGTNTLRIYIPELKFQQNSPSIPGPAGVELNLDFQAFFSTNVEESAVVIELTNDQPTYG